MVELVVLVVAVVAVVMLQRSKCSVSLDIAAKALSPYLKHRWARRRSAGGRLRQRGAVS